MQSDAKERRKTAKDELTRTVLDRFHDSDLNEHTHTHTRAMITHWDSSSGKSAQSKQFLLMSPLETRARLTIMQTRHSCLRSTRKKGALEGQKMRKNGSHKLKMKP